MTAGSSRNPVLPSGSSHTGGELPEEAPGTLVESPTTFRRSKRLAQQDPSSDESSEGPPTKRLFTGQAQAVESVLATSAESSGNTRAFLEEDPPGRISVAFNSQPPLQVRTGTRLPPLGVRITIEGSESIARLGPSLGIGTLHAVVSLWTASGELANPQAVPPVLTGHKDATLVARGPSQPYERRVAGDFVDLAISQSGYYRLRVSIMETPLPDDDGNSIHSPRQLLSVETRMIHAHAFSELR